MQEFSTLSTVKALASLREVLLYLSQDRCILKKIQQHNTWFTSDQVQFACVHVAQQLQEDKLLNWIHAYALPVSSSRRVGLVLAGNVPLVGWHDVLCTLISGHIACIKPSSRDTVLIETLTQHLIKQNTALSTRITYPPHLKEVDAVIATGHKDTALHFKRYFSHIPCLIRHNRGSCAVLHGKESDELLEKLGADVFQYFGWGCRNVSRLYVPIGFSWERLISAWQPYQDCLRHASYANNYTYQRALLQMTQTTYIDGGFFLLKEEAAVFSPISVLFYTYYHSLKEVKVNLLQHASHTQIVTSDNAWWQHSIPIGQTQKPTLCDYADGVDTLAFLSDI